MIVRLIRLLENSVSRNNLQVVAFSFKKSIILTMKSHEAGDLGPEQRKYEFNGVERAKVAFALLDVAPSGFVCRDTEEAAARLYAYSSPRRYRGERREQQVKLLAERIERSKEEIVYTFDRISTKPGNV